VSWRKNGRDLVSTDVEEKKKKEYGVFGLMLFWYNFLVFAEVIVCD
jgi:hypothetical protein